MCGFCSVASEEAWNMLIVNMMQQHLHHALFAIRDNLA
jgi:hypothetical protein